MSVLYPHTPFIMLLEQTVVPLGTWCLLPQSGVNMWGVFFWERVSWGFFGVFFWLVWFFCLFDCLFFGVFF